MQTKKVVQAMLSQAVGKITDAGSFYGRKYEKYATLEWDKIPPATWNQSDGFKRSLYHHLIDNLVLDDNLEIEFRAFVKTECIGDAIPEIAQKWAEHKKVKIAERQSSMDYESWRVKPIDHDFSSYSGIDGNDVFVIVSTHNGFDSRIGWSEPHIFRQKSMNKPKRRVHDFSYLSLCSGELKCKDFSHVWYTYDGNFFYSEITKTPMFDGKFYSTFDLSTLYDEVADTFTLPMCAICGAELTVKEW